MYIAGEKCQEIFLNKNKINSPQREVSEPRLN
jgi:hypothetical protein